MDHLIAELAARQHGPVAHRQLRDIGMTQEQITYRLRVGRLMRHFHITQSSSSGRGADRTRIKLHRVRTIRPWERTLTDEIPTTTVARTLLDLSPHLRPRVMEDAIAHANRLGLFDLLAVRRCLDEHPRQHGAPALRRLLDALAGTGATDLRSTLEVLLLQLSDDHQLPAPATNAQVEGFTVDFYKQVTRQSNAVAERVRRLLG